VQKPIGAKTHRCKNPSVQKPIGAKTHRCKNPSVQKPYPKKSLLPATAQPLSN
jgi:hypothetical protein